MTRSTLFTAMDIKKLHKDYCTQKNRAARRFDAVGNKIKFLLSFEEWLQIWTESGKLHLRGSTRGSYVMSRKNDLGHYELGNVFIQSQADNIRDASLGKKNPKKSEAFSRPCTLDGITVYPSCKALRAALGQGKTGTRSPNLRYIEETV